MTQIGAVRAPQPIPDPNLLNPAIGQRQSSPTFFLRSTPPIFTVLNVGGSNTNQDFAFKAASIPGAAQWVPESLQRSRSITGAGVPDPFRGFVRLEITASILTAGDISGTRVLLPITATITTRGSVPATSSYPRVLYDAAFQSQPLTAAPAWSDLSGEVRGMSIQRGRSYEFDRMETGTLSSILNNRTSALSPANTASPYAPLRSTRPVRAQLFWNGVTYPLFRGISEGYPQSFPSYGKDALVAQNVNDLFYALNNSRFTPGATTLTAPLAVVAQNAEETITVASTALPLPQAVPFTITVAGLTSEWPTEEMQVEEIVSASQYRVTRNASTIYEHPAGAEVTTEAVSFPEELSGTRIQRVLAAVGFTSTWWDLDAGQSLITASEDLAQVAPLEHINAIADAEFGRFFVSRDGKFTFRDRHSVILDSLTPVLTFKDETLLTGAVDEVPFSLSGPLEHSDQKLYNRVKITVPSGDIVDIKDQASIDQHFERIFERTYPYANLNDADSAARYVLARSAEDTLRLPAIDVHPVRDPGDLWPLLLSRELGDRCRFRYQPEGGGTEINKDVIIDGISHSIGPMSHSMSFQCTEVDATQYWILGRAGYTELGSSTRVGF